MNIDMNAMHAVADALRGDGKRDVHEVLGEHGIEIADETEVKIVENTADTYYFALPPDPNRDLSDEALKSAVGGNTSSSASSAFTAGTAPSCVSSVSSVGTAGTRSAETQRVGG